DAHVLGEPERVRRLVGARGAHDGARDRLVLARRDLDLFGLALAAVQLDPRPTGRRFAPPGLTRLEGILDEAHRRRENHAVPPNAKDPLLSALEVFRLRDRLSTGEDLQSGNF